MGIPYADIGCGNIRAIATAFLTYTDVVSSTQSTASTKTTTSTFSTSVESSSTHTTGGGLSTPIIITIPSPQPSSKSSIGAIVGGVVGGIAILACIAAATIFFVLKRRKEKSALDAAGKDGGEKPTSMSQHSYPTEFYGPMSPTGAKPDDYPVSPAAPPYHQSRLSTQEPLRNTHMSVEMPGSEVPNHERPAGGTIQEMP